MEVVFLFPLEDEAEASVINFQAVLGNREVVSMVGNFHQHSGAVLRLFLFHSPGEILTVYCRTYTLYSTLCHVRFRTSHDVNIELQPTKVDFILFPTPINSQIYILCDFVDFNCKQGDCHAIFFLHCIFFIDPFTQCTTIRRH